MSDAVATSAFNIEKSMILAVRALGVTVLRLVTVARRLCTDFLLEHPTARSRGPQGVTMFRGGGGEHPPVTEFSFKVVRDSWMDVLLIARDVL